MDNNRKPRASRKERRVLGYLEGILFEVGSRQKCLFSSVSEFLWFTSSTITCLPTQESLDEIQEELVQYLFNVDEQAGEMKMCCYVRACRENLRHGTSKMLAKQLELISNYSVQEEICLESLDQLKNRLTEYIVQQHELKKVKRRRTASTAGEIVAYVDSFQTMVHRSIEQLSQMSIGQTNLRRRVQPKKPKVLIFMTKHLKPYRRRSFS